MFEMPCTAKRPALLPLVRAAALIGLPLVGLTGVAAPAQAQAVIKSQDPCKPDGSACFVYRYRIPPEGFGRPGRSGVMVRGFGFTAPTAGTARVDFHGTLYCANSDSAVGHKVVDMVSQIVTGDREIATLAGPSALRHANVFVDPDTSMTFNLASTRVLQVPVGPSVVYFVTTSLKTDSSVRCYYYGAVFSVTFVS